MIAEVLEGLDSRASCGSLLLLASTLRDWAIIDLRTPAGTQYSDKIVAADFFDQQWKVKASME